ncbi:DUF6069 family protein [Micromonospora humi]|uniref:Uncharacterized protein n=1 Tax=Micromonospora humi TaxID=745366 RepID=A0A1C5GJF8_9ACTN|nr:DUF6069 family protein [Micromonospora humi]SCG33903.1 hypothetical protein GA0070213_10167 [Micromonospora humi]
MADLSRAAVVTGATVGAVVVNLVVYAVGRAAGGTFRFTAAAGPAEVNGATVAAFSALPLLVGLTAVALLAPRFDWVVRAASIVGPALAVLTIVAMTLPTDLDATSKTTLAVCHLTLVPIILVAVAALGRRTRPEADAVAA